VPSACLGRCGCTLGAGEITASAVGYGLRAAFEVLTHIIGPHKHGLGDLHVLEACPAEVPGTVAPGGRLDPGRSRREEPALHACSLNHYSPSMENSATKADPLGAPFAGRSEPFARGHSKMASEARGMWMQKSRRGAGWLPGRGYTFGRPHAFFPQAR